MWTAKPTVARSTEHAMKWVMEGIVKKREDRVEEEEEIKRKSLTVKLHLFFELELLKYPKGKPVGRCTIRRFREGWDTRHCHIMNSFSIAGSTSLQVITVGGRLTYSNWKSARAKTGRSPLTVKWMMWTVACRL